MNVTTFKTFSYLEASAKAFVILVVVGRVVASPPHGGPGRRVQKATVAGNKGRLKHRKYVDVGMWNVYSLRIFYFPSDDVLISWLSLVGFLMPNPLPSCHSRLIRQKGDLVNIAATAGA